MLKYGENNIGRVVFGSNEIGKAYFGSNLVFSKGSGPTPPSPMPEPVYELPEAISQQNYNTEVVLFDTPKSFTIFLDATWNQYGWNSGQQHQSIFGIGTAASNYFRFGRIQQGNDYQYGELVATDNRYCAIVMNDTSSAKNCSSVFARGTDTDERRQVVVRYDHTTRVVKVDEPSGSQAHYYTVSGALTSSLSLYLFTGGASGTMHDLKIYAEYLSDAQVRTLFNT